MNRQDLDELEKRIMAEVVRRRKLGGYSQDAEGLLILCESMLQIIMHLKERTPRTR